MVFSFGVRILVLALLLFGLVARVEQIGKAFRRRCQRLPMLGPAHLARWRQRPQTGGGPAEQAVSGGVGECAAPEAPDQMLAAAEFRALALERMRHGFIGIAVCFGAKPHEQLRNRNAHGAHLAAGTAQAKGCSMRSNCRGDGGPSTDES